MSRCTPHDNIDAGSLTGLLVNATYFVDSQFGNDATGQPQDESRPYQTLAAVAALVQPGQVVYVQPGTYSIPVLNLGGAIWYFSAGATTTTLITGTGQIFGSGNFIGQSPIVNHTSPQPIFIQANTFTTASDFAIIVSSSSRAQFYIKNIFSQHGIRIDAANVDVRLEISGFIGSGIFAHLFDNSSGSFCCKFSGLQCEAALYSTTNSFSVSLDGDCVRCAGDYIVNVADSSAASVNTVRANINLNRAFCSGVLRVVGLSTVMDVLSQPNVNMHIQNIESLTNDLTPTIYIDRGFCNIEAGRFAYSRTVPGGYVVDVQDWSILHISAQQIYNSDDSFPDPNLLRATANNFCGIRALFNECYTTAQIINCNGPGATIAFSALNLTVQSAAAPFPTIVNNGGSCLIECKNAQLFYGLNAIAIQNAGRMHFEASALAFYTEAGTFCDNLGQAIFRIGFMQTASVGSRLFGSSGALGLALGSIRMDGPGNIAILSRGLTILNVGQILSTTNGNVGIFVEDPGELYGRVGRVVMQDNSCLETRTNCRVVISFDEMINGANSYVVYIAGSSEVVLTGGLIAAQSVKYPIFIEGSNAKFDINLAKLSVGECAAAVFVTAPNCDVNLTMQHFEVTQNLGTAAIYAEDGTVTVKGGRFIIRTADPLPVFRPTNRANMHIDVNFLESVTSIMESDTRGNIWYSTLRSETTDPYNAFELTPQNGEFTLSGYIKTRGDHVARIGGVDPFSVMRVLNATLVSSGANIVSTGAVANFVCNGSVGNVAPIGIAPIPLLSFTTNAGVQ